MTIHPRVLLAVIALLVAACSPQSEPELTTTTSSLVTTTTAPAETTTTASATTTSVDTDVPEAVTSYEIIVRSSTDQGEVLWVLVPPGDYDTISLQNFVARVVDETDLPVAELHAFDDRAGLDAGRIDPDARTTDEQELVDSHYLVSLEQGSVIRFQGPFAEFGQTILGS